MFIFKKIIISEKQIFTIALFYKRTLMYKVCGQKDITEDHQGDQKTRKNKKITEEKYQDQSSMNQHLGNTAVLPMSLYQ